MELSILTVTTEELEAARRSAVTDLCIAAHDNEAFRDLFNFIPSGGRHFLGYLGAELVSHAVVTTRWAQPEGERILKTAFVDAVSTAPTYQGRGFGGSVMQHLGAGVPDYELGCLQTDRPKFYERVGWELWLGPLGGRDGDSVIPTPDQRGVMILRLPSTPPLDTAKGLTIERQPSRIWE